MKTKICNHVNKFTQNESFQSKFRIIFGKKTKWKFFLVFSKKVHRMSQWRLNYCKVSLDDLRVSECRVTAIWSPYTYLLTHSLTGYLVTR